MTYTYSCAYELNVWKTEFVEMLINQIPMCLVLGNQQDQRKLSFQENLILFVNCSPNQAKIHAGLWEQIVKLR